jgi:predicted PurR-regulated permease PerM
LQTRLPNLVIGGNLAKIPLPHVLEPVREQVIPMLNRAATNLESSVVPFLRETGARLLSGLGAMLPIILVPILAFFFLKDGRSLRRTLVSSIEVPAHARTVDGILSGVHDVLRNYIRALVMLAICSFIAWGIFLSVFGYPYELLLAGVSAILEFIPVVGPIASLVTVGTVCLATGSGSLLWIVVFWAAFRLFQDYVLQPYLMSSGVELHPVLVLFGVLAGEALGGIPGMFFSIPIIAILRVIYQQLRKHDESAEEPARLIPVSVGSAELR